MALVSVTTVVDDLDASTDGVATYTFALQGVTYEIDLSTANADQFFALLNPYLKAGRRLPKSAAARKKTTAAEGASRTTASSTSPTTSQAGRRRGAHRRASEPAAPELRNWWAEKAQELDLPTFRTRGAIPRQVRDAYATHAQR